MGGGAVGSGEARGAGGRGRGVGGGRSEARGWDRVGGGARPPSLERCDGLLLGVWTRSVRNPPPLAGERLMLFWKIVFMLSVFHILVLIKSQGDFEEVQITRVHAQTWSASRWRPGERILNRRLPPSVANPGGLGAPP